MMRFEWLTATLQPCSKISLTFEEKLAQNFETDLFYIPT